MDITVPIDTSFAMEYTGISFDTYLNMLEEIEE
jgi:hypothetical protein